MTNLTASGWLASFYDELTERRGTIYVVKASAIRPVEREDGNFDIALIVGRELTSNGAEAYASGLRSNWRSCSPSLRLPMTRPKANGHNAIKRYIHGCARLAGAPHTNAGHPGPRSRHARCTCRTPGSCAAEAAWCSQVFLPHHVHAVGVEHAVALADRSHCDRHQHVDQRAQPVR